MTTAEELRKWIVVTGDVTTDWNLARIRSTPSLKGVWNAKDQTIAYGQPGGAWLLANLISRIKGNCPVWQMAADQEALYPGNSTSHHSYAIWEKFPASLKKPGPNVWRVSGFLGLKQSAQRASQELDDPAKPLLIVVDDADLGFRQGENNWAWPKAIKEQDPFPWIIIKMASPVAQGDLWKELYQRHAHRLVVVMSVNDLRRSEVQISRELSWEAATQDLIRELSENPQINALSRCAYVVVSFDLAGALLLEGRGWPLKYSLFLDPKRIEGMWEEEYPGKMIGYNTCLAASLARQIVLDHKAPNIPQGVKSGLAAMRDLHQAGYEAAVSGNGGLLDLHFPCQKIARTLTEEPGAFPEMVEIPPYASALPGWTILQQRYTGSLEPLSQRVIERGAAEVLQGVPWGQFGGLLTADRQEVEGFRSIRNLIVDYYHSSQTAPLPLAVFGPPGSGKSFGVKQVAKSALMGQIEEKEFNLSQFKDPSELAGAFHQVRDIALRGKLPLVFWDEFDTALEGVALGWLQYFLAPMQDGAFQEGQITHPLGRAIFVFAGGTKPTMAAFDLGPDDADFRKVKGPDFVSRLKGHVNILGPNPQETEPGAEPVPDPFYILRRAILLRSLLLRHWPALFAKERDKDVLPLKNIDPGVLKALLLVDKYKHGVRSMETIVSTSRLAGKTKFERSALPPADQIHLHVDSGIFLKLVDTPLLDENLVERLAALVHRIYWECYPETPWPETFEELPEEFRESNRAFVRHLPIKLARLGYLMTPALEGEAPLLFPERLRQQLAEMEHDRWMQEKIAFGWRYGPERDNINKIHPALLPWEPISEEEKRHLSPLEKRALAAIGDKALPQSEKKKDCCMVHRIPEILLEAGYTIIKPQRVRVGVTGHRQMTDTAAARAGIQQALKRISRTFHGQPWVVLSSLAEGADRLVGRLALENPRTQLLVPLPFPPEEFLQDFQTATSRGDFHELLRRASETRLMKKSDRTGPRPFARSESDEAYVAASRHILDNCDILLALWDGAASDKPGGTAWVVQQARGQGKPLAWVRLGKAETGEAVAASEEQKELVTFESFPADKEVFAEAK